MLRVLGFTTAGESHGRGMIVILEGLPSGLRLLSGDVSRELLRRQLGHGRGGRMRIERDLGEIMSGVRHGETMGSPITVLIPNRAYENWRVAMAVDPVAGAAE